MRYTGSWRRLAWCGVALAWLAATSAQANCADIYRFEARPQLGVGEMARLRVNHVSDLGQDWLSWAAFDPRPAPDDGGWSKVVLVAAGEYGTGVTSLGGVLWTRRPEGRATVGRIVKRPGALEAVFGPVAGACPDRYVFRLQADGTVTAGGVKLGSTRGAP